MIGPFSILTGFGPGGLLLAVLLSLVSGALVLKFVVKFMVPDMEDATWKQCLMCNAAMYGVFIAALFCLRIPIDFVNGVAFILVLYFGQIAVVQGIFEIREGAGTVLFFFNMMNVVLMYLVYWLLVGDITKANAALAGSGLGGGMSLELMQELEEKKLEAQMREEEAKFRDEEAQRRAKIAAESVAPPKTIAVAPAPDSDLAITQVFASRKVEQEELFKAIRRRVYGRVLGLRIASKKPLKLEGMTMGLSFEDPATGFSDSPLNNWPRAGKIYANITPPFKLVPAKSDGAPIHDGYLMDLDEKRVMVLGSKEGLEAEAALPPEGLRFYYLFFATPVPAQPTVWYFYLMDGEQTCLIKSLGDAGETLRKK